MKKMQDWILNEEYSFEYISKLIKENYQNTFDVIKIGKNNSTEADIKIVKVMI